MWNRPLGRTYPGEGPHLTRFDYTAVQPDGTPIRGAIEASDDADAERRLAALGLESIELIAASTAARSVRLGAADLQTFNEYLLQISRAGLPIESGLAALSRELRSGKLKRAVDALADDLRAGVPLEKAVAGRRGSFPPLYGQLIDAGVQTADLPGVLGRFGKHAMTIADLRAALWRACSYPAVVFLALLALLTFLGYGVLPRYFALVAEMPFRSTNIQGLFQNSRAVRGVNLPVMAWAMLYLGRLAPFILVLIVVAVLSASAAYTVLRARGRERPLVDALLRLPLIGRALRDSYVASWLDIASLGSAAGLDLPRALRLAGNAVALPSLQQDTNAIVERLESGQRVGNLTLARLPATVPMLIDLASGPGELPSALAALANQYEQQARRQINVLPGRIMPVLLVAIGLVAGGIMYSLWAPLSHLLASLTG